MKYRLKGIKYRSRYTNEVMVLDYYPQYRKHLFWHYMKHKQVNGPEDLANCDVHCFSEEIANKYIEKFKKINEK